MGASGRRFKSGHPDLSRSAVFRRHCGETLRTPVVAALRSIEQTHRLLKAQGQRRLDRVRRTDNRLAHKALFNSVEATQDVIDQIIAIAGPDPDPKARILARSEMRLNRCKTPVPAARTRHAKPQPANRERGIVHHYPDMLRLNAVIARQSPDSLPRQIHERDRLDQENLGAFNHSGAHQGPAQNAGYPNGVPTREFIHHCVADVVSRAFIPRAGVSEAYNDLQYSRFRAPR